MTTIADPLDRAAIVAAYRELAAAGMNHGSSGNISCRLISGRLLITPTGATADTLTEQSLVMLDMDGRGAEGGVPSSEWEMHAAVYEAYPQVQAVVHTHADYCVALSCLHEDLPPFHYMIAGFGGNDVRCAIYAPFGSSALSQAAVAALEDRKACLLANHGMLVTGRTMSQAVAASIRLETLARQYAFARQMGTPVLLSDDEMADVHDRYRHYGTARMPR